MIDQYGIVAVVVIIVLVGCCIWGLCGGRFKN